MDWANWSMSRKILLPASALLLIILFFNWQASGPFGFNGWHGSAGVILGLLTIALLAWEIIEAFVPNVRQSLKVPSGLVGGGLAVLVTAFVLIKFFSANEFRAWPAWVGLLLGIVIAYGGWLRFSESGEALPSRASMSSGGGSSGTTSGGDTPPPPPPPAAPPAQPGGMGSSGSGSSGMGGGSSDREDGPPA
jgi:hypothetical protein